VLSTEERYSRLRLRTMGRELGLDVSGIDYVAEKDLTTRLNAALSVVMENHLLPPLPAFANRNVFVCQFPFPMDADYLSECWSYLKRYDLVIVYSEFVARHLHRQAGIYGVTLPEITIIPPPVRQMGGKRGEPGGAPRILNVGRFYPGGHCKRQDNLIEAFRTLRASVPDAELHLAGVLPPDSVARDFFVHLRHLAREEPVFFHLNASLDELRELYNGASAYWHATGLGVSVELFPERFEHFGITILEAMSAGAVPFVLGEGGPVEFVAPNENGYLWHTEEELVESTRAFFALPVQAQSTYREKARQTAAEFDEERFRNRVRATLGA
jgi:O-antigen biosynthesis protein